MKTPLLFLAATLTAGCVQAAGDQTIDLGNGTSVEVRNGKVSLKTNPGAEGGGGSVSQSVSSRSGTDGETVTSVTSDRNGQRVTRRITVSKDGTVTVSGGPEGEAPVKEKTATAPSGGWLGVHTIPLSEALRAQVDVPEGEGVLLEIVSAGGPAAKAGLLANDILLSLDGTPVKSVEAFRQDLGKRSSGKAVSLTYLRKGKTATATATLGDRPAEAPPGEAVSSEAQRLMKEMQAKEMPGRRAVVVDGEGRVRVVEAAEGDPFELLLKNPDVPEEVKARLRKTQEQFRKAQPAVPPEEN